MLTSPDSTTTNGVDVKVGVGMGVCVGMGVKVGVAGKGVQVGVTEGGGGNTRLGVTLGGRMITPGVSPIGGVMTISGFRMSGVGVKVGTGCRVEIGVATTATCSTKPNDEQPKRRSSQTTPGMSQSRKRPADADDASSGVDFSHGCNKFIAGAALDGNTRRYRTRSEWGGRQQEETGSSLELLTSYRV